MNPFLKAAASRFLLLFALLIAIALGVLFPDPLGLLVEIFAILATLTLYQWGLDHYPKATRRLISFSGFHDLLEHGSLFPHSQP